MSKNLKKIREEYQISAKEVAEQVGISKSYYSMIENDKRGLSYINALKIAAVFDMKPDDIFYEEVRE
ncbi:MAG TPA: helix-turn-helix transcriptional regulator [Candidatus Tetragenococcus pullicola]|nr:helix-turn-helix transcriptional regulator [Candidatus Tetragenococcus pullicola]